MNAREGVDIPINYDDFSDPHTGLAAMILVQAASDLAACGNKECIRRDGYFVVKREVVSFLKSQWAVSLANFCGMETSRLRK